MLNFVRGEILAIDKPRGMTSFACVAFVRTRLSRALGVKRLKVGHAGTLDPLATGVLLLTTGKATKRIPMLQLTDKEYMATLKFGATTASYDMEHPENAHFPTTHITQEQLEAVLKNFKGDIMQVPPTFSACSVNGERAYKLARQDKEVTLQAKPIHIEEIELLHFDDKEKTADIRVVCGKGTYIRSLARDIGQTLSSGAYLTSLCRRRVGEYRLEDCIKVDDFVAWLSRQEIAPYSEE